MEKYGYDAVVVGSGYGGSVAAWHMSMAGLKVCLVEKGSQWEPEDFPKSNFDIFAATSLKSSYFGPNNALFQIHTEEDAIAVTACGLGGGSLVNAAVMAPTPRRARRNPKWPESWERDWDRYEASVSEMLRIQNVPTRFQNSKIMEAVIGDEYEQGSMKLGINFEIEESSKSSGTCLGCGNCLAGCPYNAKNSTDKTYLHSALQAGCTIKTECEVQYVVRNDSKPEEGSQGTLRGTPRRWLVFLNEFDYIASDIVVLSGGVFGTSKILFQSRLRGLAVSEKLGSGVSCNGNSVAYVVRASAPLNAVGLDRNELFRKPFQERPGPSITSSYTSSLGFTIQSAVLPTAYPRFLFKGITTYRWQSNHSFLNAIVDWLKYFLRSNCNQEMVLNAIGHDDCSGKLIFNKDTNKIRFQPPHDHLLPRKIEAFQRLAKKLGGVLFISRHRSTSVHLLGGCIASNDVSSGVCNPEGQVFNTTLPTGVHSGLYICDASIIPCSVGINPCITIAAAAEHVSRHIVATDSVKTSEDVDRKAGSIHKGDTKKNWESRVLTSETMRGQVGGMQCTAYLKLRFGDSCVDKNTSKASLLRGKVGGYVECRAIEMDKMHIIHGEVDLCGMDSRTPYTQYMRYRLLVAASSGSRYILEGTKTMNPYLLALYLWRESTTLNVTLRKVVDNAPNENVMSLNGSLHISPFELLRSIYALEGGSKVKFVCLLLQSLFRTYFLQKPRVKMHDIDIAPVELVCNPYPNSISYEIKTEDGFTISCQQWKSNDDSQQRLQEMKKLYPVLLINGYTTESYCLPTENNDLVRTLLKDGHDVWLVQTQLHWSNPSNHFTIEDIGKMDIPAVIHKLIEYYGESTKIHVVAHCVGGLAIHISLMGGYISAKHIASLSCTNSSMFFKLTTSSLVKMWLPLLPISMAIMGKDKILPILQPPTTSFRHKVLKSIARLIPRYERCTYGECEVLSGIFGNAFWHNNISPALHHWMHKENIQNLPMAAFPHLRKICTAGFIVDGEGSNSYLIHPERMSLPTLYISGERSLLVTPKTSFLANKYMKLHQPSYRHERVVIDGFGHSDLLIGEKSGEEVFPHIQRHIELGEDENCFKVVSKERKYVKEALEWSEDLYEDDGGRFRGWIFTFVTILVFIFIFRFLFFWGFY